MKGQKNYDKSMEISPGTCLEIVPTSGRFVLALKGFNGARTNRRLIDFKTQHTLDIWKKEIDAIASKSIARALSIAYNPGMLFCFVFFVSDCLLNLCWLSHVGIQVFALKASDRTPLRAISCCRPALKKRTKY